MSNELTTTDKKNDFSENELKKLVEFKEKGLPGISGITTSQASTMLNLYLAGSTYTQISNTVGVKKSIVLYLSDINKWYDTKVEYLKEIEEKIKNSVIDTKLRSKEFMLLLVQAWQKKIGDNLVKYLATNDPSFMADMDLKEVAQLMKAIDMVNNMNAADAAAKGKAPLVGINPGEGVTIERTGDNQVTVSPINTFGDMIRKLADNKRDEEEKKTKELAPKITNNQ